jgi:large subunit ribosomal protein L25
VSTGFNLEITDRTGGGKAVARRLRREGKVPAIVYGGGREPATVALDSATLALQMQREAFYTSILTLKRGNETQAVIVKDVQRHPAGWRVLHLDFQRILEDEEITLHVPIHFLNEETAKGVKDQGGVLEHLLTDVEVSCLPRYLPEYLSLDVAELELNGILHLSDIVLPEGVTIVALEHKQNHAVVAISPPRREEEEVPVVAPGEVPATEAAAAQAAGTDEAGKAGGEGSKG